MYVYTFTNIATNYYESTLINKMVFYNIDFFQVIIQLNNSMENSSVDLITEALILFLRIQINER